MGLACPSCGAPIPPPTTRFARCEACGRWSNLVGDVELPSRAAPRTVTRAAAVDAVRRFLTGPDRVAGLSSQATIDELLPVLVPYWRLSSEVAGLVTGYDKRGDTTSWVQRRSVTVGEWVDAAADVSELGVQRVDVPADSELRPFAPETARSEALVFAPVESPEQALEEAQAAFAARLKATLTDPRFAYVELGQDDLELVYHPLWICRYLFQGRSYAVAVDGWSGAVLYGRAPRAIFWRAAGLASGLALGNLVLVFAPVAMTAMAFSSGGSDVGQLFCLLPVVVGAGFGMLGTTYKAFRFGATIEFSAQTKEAR